MPQHSSLDEQLTTSFMWLERLTPETQSVVKTQLERIQIDILSIVANETDIVIIKREIQELFTQAFSTFETVLLEDRERITELAFNATQNIMAAWTTIEAIKLEDATQAVRNRLLNQNTLVQGFTLKNHFAHIRETQARKVQGIIANGFEQGVGIQQINRDIRNSIGGLQRTTIDSLTRTTLLEAIRNSQESVFDYFEDEITEYYYNSTLDTRTTPRCYSLNNTSSRNREDITKLLNFHYRCRSILGVRTSLSEQFDQEQRIVEWDRRTVNHRDGTTSTEFTVDEVRTVRGGQSPEFYFRQFDTRFQREYMGATRYRLWREGRATFEQMISRSRNTFIPLDELRRRLDI